MAKYSIIWNFEELTHEQLGKRARIFDEQVIRTLMKKLSSEKVNHSNFLRVEVLHSISKYNHYDLAGTILTITIDHENDQIICHYKRVSDNGASIDIDYYGNSRFDYVYKYFYTDKNCTDGKGNFCEFSKGFGIRLVGK